MRNSRRFVLSDYNFQLGFYPQPYWVIPELEVFISITVNSKNQFTPRALTDALVSCKKMAELKLKRLENENLDHPEPLKNLHKSSLPQNELLTIKQIAKVLQLSISAVRTLIDNKILKSIKTSGGHRRVQIIDVLNYKKTLETAFTQTFIQNSPTENFKPMTQSFLRIKDATETLNMSTTTLWRKYKKGTIKGHLFGKEVRFLESEIVDLCITNFCNTNPSTPHK